MDPDLPRRFKITDPPLTHVHALEVGINLPKLVSEPAATIEEQNADANALRHRMHSWRRVTRIVIGRYLRHSASTCVTDSGMVTPSVSYLASENP